LAVHLRDITERKRAAEEIELLLAREQAAGSGAAAARDDFLATMSHEPLADQRDPAVDQFAQLERLDANTAAPSPASTSARLQAWLIDRRHLARRRQAQRR
jgi:hypothetical protein